MLYNTDLAIAGLVFLALILIYHKIEYRNSDIVNKGFERLGATVFFSSLVDVISSWTMGHPEGLNTTAISWGNFLYFLANGLMGMYLVDYVTLFTADRGKNFFDRWLNRIIFWAYALALVLNQFLGFFFVYTAEGVYIHKDYYLIAVIVPLFFVVYATTRILMSFRTMTRRQAGTLVAFMMIVILGDMIQVFITPNILVTSFGTALGFTLLMFSLETPDYRRLSETMTELKAARKEADAANAAKSAFLANMSHEIRTPINAIIGMNEMIVRESTQNEVQEYAETVKHASTQLLEIINDILDISKIESGKMEMLPGDYNPYGIVRDVVDVVRMRTEPKGLTLDVVLDPKLPRKLYGDEKKLRQIIMNLMTNAAKYTHEGGIVLSVGGEVNEGKYDLAVSVKDTGTGIRAEDMDKLFENFRRIDEGKNRNIEGTGLGLSITTSFLKMMGSELKVSSVYGEGSDFSFVLPQEIVDLHPETTDDRRSETTEKRKEYDASFTGPDIRLLVVDDSEMNLLVFTKLLKQTLVRIDSVTRGADAVAKCKENRYDIIFMDHMMPEMDGIETLNVLRTSEENLSKNAPVIALTANAFLGAEQFYLDAGFSAFLSKPFKPSELEAMIVEYSPKEKVRLA